MCNNSFHTHAKQDPTKTLTTRRRFESDVVRRFKNLRRAILKQIIELEGFGNLGEPIRNRGQFDFPRSDEKVSAFMDWLRQQQQTGDIDLVLPERPRMGAVDRRWANVYIDSAYQQGIRRARAELKKQGIDVPDDTEPSQVLRGFNNPVHADRVGLIYTRVYSDLKGITDEMDKQISRVLAQGNRLALAQSCSLPYLALVYVFSESRDNYTSTIRVTWQHSLGGITRQTFKSSRTQGLRK